MNSKIGDAPISSPLEGEPFDPALRIARPTEQVLPMVFASPHSGRIYPPAFLAQSALTPETLRRSEDSFVDELWASAPDFGAPLLMAQFPRAYLDVNREAYELDPAMFSDPLPAYVNRDSVRVTAGLGTIARVVASGADIYRHKLTFAEAQQRIHQLYQPYHDTLRFLVQDTVARFGYCILVDCHSMPSSGAVDSGYDPAEFVLGDCFGSSCAPQITRAAEETLSRLGYAVQRNAPYAGGYTTRYYGNPRVGVHALQIEINRRLYMDEATHVKTATFARLQNDLGRVISALASLQPDSLKPQGDRL